MSSQHALPSWFVSPDENDFFAWLSLFFIALAVYGIFVLYAKFDHWVEHRSKGTPLAKTIPTMLTIALLYEIFPLGHFNILLPISAILIALMADFAHFRFGSVTEESEIVIQDNYSEQYEEPIVNADRDSNIDGDIEDVDALDEGEHEETKNV